MGTRGNEIRDVRGEFSLSGKFGPECPGKIYNKRSLFGLFDRKRTFNQMEHGLSSFPEVFAEQKGNRIRVEE